MLYQILMTHQFPFKAKKILVQGPSNSGKSVWIVPLFEILDSENIASITREGKFGAALMTKETEAVFVDEVSPKTIDLDEFKGILQGGWLAVPQKHAKANRIVYSSAIYMTCNKVIMV